MTWNLITGLIATLIGIVYGWQALRLPHATFGTATGHIVYPVILGGVMTIAGSWPWCSRSSLAKGPKSPKCERRNSEN